MGTLVVKRYKFATPAGRERYKRTVGVGRQLFFLTHLDTQPGGMVSKYLLYR